MRLNVVDRPDALHGGLGNRCRHARRAVRAPRSDRLSLRLATPNGARAYVTNASAKSVSAIDTATNRVVATVGVGTNPVDVAITPDGARAYVANSGSNSASVIDTSANAVTATVPVGANPVNAAIF
jgi:YVTN family beta-propeller protein